MKRQETTRVPKNKRPRDQKDGPRKEGRRGARHANGEKYSLSQLSGYENTQFLFVKKGITSVHHEYDGQAGYPWA